MSRLLPFPVMAAALLALWLMLNQSLSVGHLLLGTVIAVLGSKVLVQLDLPPLRIRRPLRLLELGLRVIGDVIRSNFAVAKLMLQRSKSRRRSGFMTVPLELRDPYGIALLAAIISSTPGTVWVRYHRTRGLLLIHVFDLVDEAHWVRVIKERYERRLMEIFE
ncbi:MAG: Na+/H+ antiporter subunit E [Myxococcaceae bacterium]